MRSTRNAGIRQTTRPGRAGSTLFVVTAGFFAFQNEQWLAGLLCGFAYLGPVLHKRRLGDAITAHAITNFLLGAWVVWRNAWNFW